MPRLARLLTSLGPLAFLTSMACEPSLDEIKEACAKGAAKACLTACRRGVLGHDGCLGAAGRATVPQRGKYFDEACRGKLLEGCLQGAKLHRNLHEREKYATAVDRACSLGHTESCSTLGDLRLGSSRDQALDAYRRGCKLAKRDVADCERQSVQLTTDVDRFLTRCRSDDLASCEQALSLLAKRNHDAAYLAAKRICERRGLTEHYHRGAVKAPLYLERPENKYDQCGLFLVARSSVAGTDSVWPKRRQPAPASKAKASVALAVDSLDIHFRGKLEDSPETLVEVKKELTRDLDAGLPRALPCFEAHLEGQQTTAIGKTVQANFIVDRLGEPLDLRASSEIHDPELTNCIVDAALPETFGGRVRQLKRIPIVQLKLKVSEP